MRKLVVCFLMMSGALFTFANSTDSTELYVYSYVFSDKNVLVITQVEKTDASVDNKAYLLSLISHNRVRLFNHIRSFYPEMVINVNNIQFEFAATKDGFGRSREDLLAENEGKLVELFEFKLDFLRKESLRNVKIE